MKTCSCKKVYLSIPKLAKKNEDGYWFNCTCRSTLFWPIKKQGVIKMKHLINLVVILSALFLLPACEEAKSEEEVLPSLVASPIADEPVEQGPVDVTIRTWGARGFECLMVSGQVWCHEPFYPDDSSALHLNSTAYVPMWIGNITKMEVKDDTLCYSGFLYRDDVVDTHCVGEGNFVAQDIDVDGLFDSGMPADGIDYVSFVDEVCSLDNEILTCQFFTIDTHQ